MSTGHIWLGSLVDKSACFFLFFLFTPFCSSFSSLRLLRPLLQPLRLLLSLLRPLRLLVHLLRALRPFFFLSFLFFVPFVFSARSCSGFIDVYPPDQAIRSGRRPSRGAIDLFIHALAASTATCRW